MMAKHNTSENMKALQKRYIPANIFVAILAFVAALATLFLPWLDVRVQIDGEKLAPIVASMLEDTNGEGTEAIKQTGYTGGLLMEESDPSSAELDVGELVATAVQELDVTVSLRIDPMLLLSAGTGTETEVTTLFNDMIADGDVGKMINDTINENMPSVMTGILSSTVTNTLKELQKSQQENAAGNPDAFVLSDEQIEKVGEYISSYEEDFNTVFQNLSENKTEEAKEAFSALVNDVVTELPEKMKEEFPELGENSDEGVNGIVESIPEEKINAVFDAVVNNAQDEEGNFNWLNLIANMGQLQEDIANAGNEENSGDDSSTEAPVRPMVLRYSAENPADGQEAEPTENEQLDQIMAVLENPGEYVMGMLLEQFTLEEIQMGCLALWGVMVGFPALLWAILGLCAFLRIFMAKKRVRMWYVKLFCLWSGLGLLIANVATAYAPTLVNSIMGAGETLPIFEALSMSIFGSGVVNGICWLLLVVSGWLWYNRIKKEEKWQEKKDKRLGWNPKGYETNALEEEVSAVDEEF